MANLGSKSAQEISELLDEYGIKHGPIVDSTRKLYEKKLREAMTKSTPAKTSSDKTYYREEQEEITYIHRRVPLRSEAIVDGYSPGSASGGSYYTTSESYRDMEDESGDQPSLYRSEQSYRYVPQSRLPPLRSSTAATTTAAARKETSSGSKRLIPLWVQFLVFLIVAGFLYYVFTSMENPEKNPFKAVE
ncbi:hypothetical protein JZ751_005629 [Albula glossodonta]|uniref:LEM domain-containing protein n=1 Tax=Albula glossodonta TaxID=121402 RepID=A0A8T2N5G4_9TELE|nr:hypothetical protein JZ751_005629 [Albula glossodonta]